MDLLKEFESRGQEHIAQSKETFAGVRGGRPSAKLVEDITIEYGGERLKIKQLGLITVIPPREIQISVWDAGIAGAVQAAIESVLRVTVRTEGASVRVSLPPLSEERREEIIRLLKREIEETKIKIRTLRDDILKRIRALAEEKKMTEDDRFSIKEKIDKSNHFLNETLDDLLEHKIREVGE